MTPGRMGEWHRRFIRAHGSERLQLALENGDISVQAAYRAARYLSQPQQDHELEAGMGLDFGRRMGVVERQNTGKAKRTVTAEEQRVIEDLREGP